MIIIYTMIKTTMANDSNNINFMIQEQPYHSNTTQDEHLNEHHNQPQQDIDQYQSNTTQSLLNYDGNNQPNYHNFDYDDQYHHVNSLIDSLNSSSGTIINGMNGVTIIESSLNSATDSTGTVDQQPQHIDQHQSSTTQPLLNYGDNNQLNYHNFDYSNQYHHVNSLIGSGAIIHAVNNVSIVESSLDSPTISTVPTNHEHQQSQHVGQQHSSTTQPLLSYGDSNQLNYHNFDDTDQYHHHQVNSLIDSLNSSSGTIINCVNNVSIVESSLNSSANSTGTNLFYNTHHMCCNCISNNNCNEDEFYPHTCRWSDCFLSFTDMPEFVKHIEEAHVNSIPEEKHRYYCQWTNCRRSSQYFNARYKLLIHMRVHSGEKPYPCEHESCQKSFSRLENLKIHIRSHTGEKPYSCRYNGCKKAFTNSSDRIKHHKTHLDAKPYACSYSDCEKRYTDPSSLRKHLKTHKKIDSDRNEINKVNHRSAPMDVKLSQSWSAGSCQIKKEDNCAFPNDHSHCKLAHSFTAGYSNGHMT